MGGITETIVTRIADEKGVDALELEPLHSSVDTTALEGLFDGQNSVNRVEFEYAGYEIIIEDEDQVHLEST